MDSWDTPTCVHSSGDTATCLYNSPHEDESLPRVLPGKLLTLDAQCRKDRGTSACFVSWNSINAQALFILLVAKHYKQSWCQLLKCEHIFIFTFVFLSW